MSHTALRIPVREAETIVRRRALAAGSPYQPQDGGVLAHVALLDPFLPEDALTEGVLADLERVFEQSDVFGFELTEVAVSPGGVVYLTPEPATLFSELTFAVLEVFPELRAGIADLADLAPTLVVPVLPGEDAASLQAELAVRLPLTSRAVNATLVRVAERDTRTLSTFALGSSAA